MYGRYEMEVWAYLNTYLNIALTSGKDYLLFFPDLNRHVSRTAL